jgi:integrase
MTRFPKKGKGRRWTNLELKAITAEWQGDKLSDGDGLTGSVRVGADGAVSIRFEYIFKWNGRVKWHQCGTWPTKSLETIRENRDKARALVKEGINPTDHKKASHIEAQAKIEAVIKEAELSKAENSTFCEMFEVWLSDGVARMDGNQELRRSFGKDVLPLLGNMPVKNIKESDLLKVLRQVGRDRGRGRSAQVLHADLRQLFRWAEKRQPWRGLLVECNPAELVEEKQIVDANFNDAPRERILTSDEITELQNIFIDLERTYAEAPNKRSAPRPVKKMTQIALWLCLSTSCRIGELLMSRWEHLDLTKGEWRVPAENTKTKVKWTVYMSDFALQQFKALHAISAHQAWCFPAANKDNEHIDLKTVSKQVGDRQAQFKNRTKQLMNRRQDNSLVLSQGANGEWTPHDLRRTGATIMQRLGVALEVIDRCQNHVLPGSKIRRTYQRHDYENETRDAWMQLGTELTKLLARASRQ